MKETTKNSFLVQLIEYGIRKVVFSFDFALAAAFFAFLLLGKKYGFGNIVDDSASIKNFIGVVFAIASTMFSITLAALAIILSFSNTKFMSFLRRKEMSSGILFPFWLGNVVYLVVLLLSTIYLLVKPTAFIDTYIFPLICSLFMYALLSTFYLLATVIKFGYFIGWAEDNLDQKKEG